MENEERCASTNLVVCLSLYLPDSHSKLNCHAMLLYCSSQISFHYSVMISFLT